MDEITAASVVYPAQLLIGSTVTLYRCNISASSTTEEDGSEGVRYDYTEYRFKPGEYEALCNGQLPEGVEWNEDLHERFRNTQHRRTDDLYNEAYRCRRIATNDEAGAVWDSYITALDNWNAQVTALGETYSTSVPELPQKPAA